MKKFITSVIILAIVLLQFTPCLSHELSPENNISRRWQHKTFSTVYKVYQCNLNIDSRYLDSAYKNQVSTVITTWNNNSDYRVAAKEENTSSANVRLESPSSWDDIKWGSDTIAFADGRDSNNYWWITSTPSSFEVSTYALTQYAQIRFNKKYNYAYSNSEKASIIMHELGHVLGLGHPIKFNSSTKQYENDLSVSSIMKAVLPLPSSPTLHDRNDLYDFYK